MISSGCAAWPEEDITYCAFSSADEAGVPVDDCGNVDGSVLYVYGSVVAVGKETNGETVSGTCARRGWGPVRSQCLQEKRGPRQHPRLSCIFCDPNEFQKYVLEYTSLKNDSMPRGEE